MVIEAIMSLSMQHYSQVKVSHLGVIILSHINLLFKDLLFESSYSALAIRVAEILSAVSVFILLSELFCDRIIKSIYNSVVADSSEIVNTAQLLFNHL